MVTAGKYRSAVVIGGGFIGLEVCENLQKEGIENYIHVRVDQLKTLKEYNQKLGI